MKIFALLFLLLPIGGCAYVGWHVWRLLPFSPVLKSLVLAFMLLSFSLLFVYFFVGLDRLPMGVARVAYALGTSSLFVLLYLTMLFLLLDAGHLLHLVPSGFLRSSWAGTLTVLGVMLSVFTYGYLHYHHKYCERIELKSAKPMTQRVKVLLMSDMHLGYPNTRKNLAKWVDNINAEQPDMVLIAGDIVDNSVRPLIEEGMAAEFRRIKAPVYACLGNHDYYAGEPASEQFYKDSGITLLRDSSVVAPGDILVMGRDDRTNRNRKSLKAMADEALMWNRFTILLDHQPYHLEESEQLGVDFQFSGHTHYGQMWPISWITDLLYECAYGHHQRGRTRYYVSSGIGIWGGKFRVGTRSEYVVATIGN